MVCCFLGHREIVVTENLRKELSQLIEKLIVEEKVDTFLFGSKSQFNDFCYKLVASIKHRHPQIQRIYVRAEYPVINEPYRQFLLKHYESTYYPLSVNNAGKLSYMKRNMEMIDKSDICVFYYDETYASNARVSGTKYAFEYATKRKKFIYRFPT